MVSLSNGILSISVNEFGAELVSIKYKDTEYLWQGAPDVWSKHSPILFPICGGLKDDKYILNGKTYNLKKHGFANYKNFILENITDTVATFLLREDEETLKSFPFKFEFRVIFTLIENSLNVTYKIKNLNAETMYFSIGAHEAYATPEGIEDYEIVFPQNETLATHTVTGPLISGETIPVIENNDRFTLDEKYFQIDALIFDSHKSRSVTLQNRNKDRKIAISFPDCDYLLFWHQVGAKYICIEPWSGFPDSVNSDNDITHKEGIIALSANCEQTNSHTITIME